MRDLAVIILAILGWVVPYMIQPEKEGDEDLAWIDREIAKCDEGPRSIHQDTPQMARLRNERLERLRKLRLRLLGESP